MERYGDLQRIWIGDIEVFKGDMINLRGSVYYVERITEKRMIELTFIVGNDFRISVIPADDLKGKFYRYG